MRNREGWEVKKIGEFLEQIRGVSYKPSDLGQEETDSFIPLLRANNIQNELVFEDLNFVHISKVKDVQLIKEGDILVCTSSGSKHLVGKAAQASRDLNMTFGAFCKIIRPKNINSDFLGFYFKSNIYRQKISEFSRGANINNIKTEHIDSLQIPIPPRDIQHQIVSELDTLNSIIDKKKEQLNELDNLAQATFYDMFGDPVENEKGWEVNKLGEVGELGRGVSKNRPRNSPDLLGGDIPLIQTGDIANSGLYILIHSQTYSQKGLEQSKLWKKGTLCITIAANIGKTAIMSYDACFPDSVVGFISNEDIIKNIFVHYYFLWIQQELEDNAPQVAQKNINLKILNNLDIIVPPLPLQTQFVEKIKHIEQQKALIQRSIDDVQQLFDYTMDKYFN